MATKYKEEKVVEKNITFADWLMQLPLRIFFWGSMAIMFILWLVATAFIILYLKLTMH